MENLTTGSLGCDNASAGAASSSTASSSASTSCAHYQVFINHRGPDVKNGFASHLYRRLRDRGLSVFLDREELKEGQNISSQIEDAIRDADVHVAIFSPTYAKSNWCLDELVLMKNSRAIILPVFYKVDPSVVRRTVKEGAYAEALQQLEKKTTHDSETGKEKPRYDSHTIQNWRNALSYVADLSGFVHG
jgi:hypothetical protein